MPLAPTSVTTNRPKVLVLSKNYPNDVFDVLGLWVENLVQHSTGFCEPKVISPVPYCPPLPGLPDYYARLRGIPHRCLTNEIEIFHPRMLVGPGHSLYSLESRTYYWTARRVARRLRQDFRFDLIHAHFTYPDGVAAARLGKQFGVPVIISEHVCISRCGKRGGTRVGRPGGWRFTEVARDSSGSGWDDFPPTRGRR